MGWLTDLRFRWLRWRWVRRWGNGQGTPEVLESEPWADDAPLGLHGIRDARGYPLGCACRLGCGCPAEQRALESRRQS